MPTLIIAAALAKDTRIPRAVHHVPGPFEALATQSAPVLRDIGRTGEPC
jgi:hypothetical protein